MAGHSCGCARARVVYTRSGADIYAQLFRRSCTFASTSSACPGQQQLLRAWWRPAWRAQYPALTYARARCLCGCVRRWRYRAPTRMLNRATACCRLMHARALASPMRVLTHLRPCLGRWSSACPQTHSLRISYYAHLHRRAIGRQHARARTRKPVKARITRHAATNAHALVANSRTRAHVPVCPFTGSTNFGGKCSHGRSALPPFSDTMRGIFDARKCDRLVYKRKIPPASAWLFSNVACDPSVFFRVFPVFFRFFRTKKRKKTFFESK